MEQGSKEKEVVRQHIKARMPIPEAIAGAPRLREDLKWVWEAFSDLTTERTPSGMGPPGHIPWRAVYAFARAHNMTGGQFLHFKELVKAMDDEYLEYLAKKMKREATPNHVDAQ